MALNERRAVDRPPTKTGLATDCQPFDIDLLCAKLEVARLEQDAAQSRRRYRSSVGNGVDLHSVVEDHRHSRALLGAESNSTLEWIGEPKKRSPSGARKGVHPRHLLTTLNIKKSGSEAVRDSAYFDALDLDTDEYIDSRRSSAGDIDAVRPQLNHRSNRHSADVATLLKSAPKDEAKRRSRTFPMQLSKLTPKQRPMSAYMSSSGAGPVSPMDFVNEYTISYDLADILKDEDSREPDRPVEKPAESFEQPRRLSRLRSRSLLNLNALLKKDKDSTRAQMDEVPEVSEDISESQQPPTTANENHTRQRSLPIGLSSNANTWPKTEEREKKRKSFIAFFKKFG